MYKKQDYSVQRTAYSVQDYSVGEEVQVEGREEEESKVIEQSFICFKVWHLIVAITIAW